MAKATRRTRAPKKKKVEFSRRARTGWGAAPTDRGWHYFYQYVRLEIDKNKIGNKVKAYIKETIKDKKDRTFILSVPDSVFGNAYAMASVIAFREAEQPEPADWDFDKVINLKLAEFRRIAQAKIDAKEDDGNVIKLTKSPMDIVRARTEAAIASVEEVLDQFDPKAKEPYALYDELKKDDASYNVARGICDYYTPLMNELTELCSLPTVSKQNDMQQQLAEVYGFMKKPEQKALLKFVSDLVEDAERYMLSKKALRKPQKKRVVSADKLADKVNYLKESTEYKVASINPADIIKANRVYLFNNKSRIITELVCANFEGLTIAGTTVRGYDEKSSRATRLRKPLEFLPLVLSKIPSKLEADWKALTTKPSEVNGRINKDTIILKVMNK